MNLDECDRIFAQIRDASSPSAVCHALTPLFDYYEVINIELNHGTVFWRARLTEEQPWAAVLEWGTPRPNARSLGVCTMKTCPASMLLRARKPRFWK